MKCENCNISYSITDNFCSKCGSALVSIEPNSLTNDESGEIEKAFEKKELQSNNPLILTFYAVSIFVVISGIITILYYDLRSLPLHNYTYTSLAFWVGITNCIRGKITNRPLAKSFALGFFIYGGIIVLFVSYFTGTFFN